MRSPVTDREKDQKLRIDAFQHSKVREKKDSVQEPGKEQPGRQEKNPECVRGVGVRTRQCAVVACPAAAVLLV